MTWPGRPSEGQPIPFERVEQTGEKRLVIEGRGCSDGREGKAGISARCGQVREVDRGQPASNPSCGQTLWEMHFLDLLVRRDRPVSREGEFGDVASEEVGQSPAGDLGSQPPDQAIFGVGRQGTLS